MLTGLCYTVSMTKEESQEILATLRTLREEVSEMRLMLSADEYSVDSLDNYQNAPHIQSTLQRAVAAHGKPQTA